MNLWREDKDTEVKDGKRRNGGNIRDKNSWRGEKEGDKILMKIKQKKESEEEQTLFCYPWY